MFVSLNEYAKLNNRSRAAVMSLVFRKKFPFEAVKKNMVKDRCVFIEILQDTPWPARKWAKRVKKEI